MSSYALAAALKEAGQESIVLVTGSIFLAAAVRDIYSKQISSNLTA